MDTWAKLRQKIKTNTERHSVYILKLNISFLLFHKDTSPIFGDYYQIVPGTHCVPKRIGRLLYFHNYDFPTSHKNDFLARKSLDQLRDHKIRICI